MENLDRLLTEASRRLCPGDHERGREMLAERLGVKPGTIAWNANRGALPAAWYFVFVEVLGDTPSRRLFSFKDGGGGDVERTARTGRASSAA